jgi:hypothetical protein
MGNRKRDIRPETGMANWNVWSMVDGIGIMQVL